MSTLNTHSLFPPSSKSSRHSFPLNAQHLAYGGPFPPSVIFHLALDHLKTVTLPDWNGLTQNGLGQVLCISTDKHALHLDSVKEADGWLSDYGGEIGLEDLLDSIDFRFCPTMAHFTFLLTALSIAKEDEVGSLKREKSVIKLKRSPTLIILHNLSNYLDRPDCTLSTYTSLVSLAMNLAHQLPTYPTVVLLDRHLCNVTLPTVPGHLRSSPSKKSSSPTRSEESNASQNYATRDTRTFIEKGVKLDVALEWFFDLIGVFTDLTVVDDDEESGHSIQPAVRPFTLSFRRSSRRPLPHLIQDEYLPNIQFDLMIQPDFGQNFSDRKRWIFSDSLTPTDFNS